MAVNASSKRVKSAEDPGNLPRPAARGLMFTDDHRPRASVKAAQLVDWQAHSPDFGHLQATGYLLRFAMCEPVETKKEAGVNASTMAKNGSLKCVKCNRSFALPAHYARHMSAMHGVKSPRAKARARRSGASRRAGSVVRRGRLPSAVAGLGLSKMSLDQLMSVIDAAKNAARDQLGRMSAALS